jgi:hypothetical protein
VGVLPLWLSPKATAPLAPLHPPPSFLLPLQVMLDGRTVSSVCPAANGLPCVVDSEGNVVVGARLQGVTYYLVASSIHQLPG